jgi:hypothetical protein
VNGLSAGMTSVYRQEAIYAGGLIRAVEQFKLA